MKSQFISDKLVDDISASVDSSMLKATGPVWHKSDMKNNRLPISGIDTDCSMGILQIKGLDIRIQTAHELQYWQTGYSIIC